MNTLIDLCGTPIQLDRVREFRLVKRDCIFYPSYQEVQEQTHSLFARKNASDKKKFEFVNMVPYGVLLSDKEKPLAGNYEIKSFGEAATFDILTKVGNVLGKVATLAADMLRIDTSGNMEYNLLTEGRRLIHLKLRDIPAKVRFLSGKVSDVYKNDPIFDFLGEPIAPTVAAIPTLVVTIDKTTRVFFGGGIDLDDAEAAYRILLEAYTRFHEESFKKAEKRSVLPKFSINIPKFSVPSIQFQSPLVIKKSPPNVSEASRLFDGIADPEED